MKYNVTEKLGVGSAGDAYLLEDGRAIIVGKRVDSFGTYRALQEKMKSLDGKITTIKYPKVHELIEPGDDYEYGAVVEEYISGKELRDSIDNLSDSQKRKIGKTLADFLVEFHSINTGGDKDNEISINLAKYDRSLDILKEYLASDIYDKLVEIKSDYLELLESKDFLNTHGDLNAGNIMIDGGEVSGIIDFGNMEYYIPEIEFVHMYFFDRVIYDAMVENYPRDISEREVVFLELIVNIRHFKNIRNFEDRRTNCLRNINMLLDTYLSMKD